MGYKPRSVWAQCEHHLGSGCSHSSTPTNTCKKEDKRSKRIRGARGGARRRRRRSRRAKGAAAEQKEEDKRSSSRAKGGARGGGGGGKGLGEQDELCLQPFWSKRMLSKGKRPYDESELPAACRLRENIRDIFASNTLPAARVQSLLNDASDAGVDDCREFRGIPHNAARNLRRSFLKRCLWPDLYHATVRVHDRTTGGEKGVEHCFFVAT